MLEKLKLVQFREIQLFVEEIHAMLSVIRLLLALLAICYASSLLADPMASESAPAPAAVPVMNPVNVAVVDRSAASLQLGFQSAFSEALQIMSRNPDIMKKPTIQKASMNVVQYVQSYSYVAQPNANPQLPP